MEVSIIIVSAFLVVAIIAVPLYLAYVGVGYLRVNVISVALFMVLVPAAVYCSHLYKETRLVNIGFNFEGMTDLERMRDVHEDNKKEADTLYISLLGVGWSLQSIAVIILLSPYPSVAWLVMLGVRKVGVTQRNESP